MAEQGPWREGLESGAGPATLQPSLTASCSVRQSGRGAEEGSGWGGWGRVLQALASASICHCPSRGRGWSLLLVSLSVPGFAAASLAVRFHWLCLGVEQAARPRAAFTGRALRPSAAQLARSSAWCAPSCSARRALAESARARRCPAPCSAVRVAARPKWRLWRRGGPGRCVLGVPPPADRKWPGQSAPEGRETPFPKSYGDPSFVMSERPLPAQRGQGGPSPRLLQPLAWAPRFLSPALPGTTAPPQLGGCALEWLGALLWVPGSAGLLQLGGTGLARTDCTPRGGREADRRGERRAAPQLPFLKSLNLKSICRVKRVETASVDRRDLRMWAL